MTLATRNHHDRDCASTTRERPRARVMIERHPERAPVILAMATPIVQHVGEDVARVARRLDLLRLVAEREHFAFAPELGVERTRGANCEALHAASKRFLMRGLDDQVQVIHLDRDVDDAKVRAAEEYISAVRIAS